MTHQERDDLIQIYWQKQLDRLPNPSANPAPRKAAQPAEPEKQEKTA